MNSPTKIYRCISCRKIFSDETEFNKICAVVLTRDRIEGKRTITIAEATHEAITGISTQRSGATYDDIILAALSSYKREQEIGPQTLESIANEETETEDE